MGRWVVGRWIVGRSLDSGRVRSVLGVLRIGSVEYWASWVRTNEVFDDCQHCAGREGQYGDECS
eukprot:1392897-Amorphochlora_amoeboformis.AAC.3